MDLTNDLLKLEVEMESAMNSNDDINTKTFVIKSLLAKIVTTEASITKFSGMISSNNNNDKNELKETN